MNYYKQAILKMQHFLECVVNRNRLDECPKFMAKSKEIYETHKDSFTNEETEYLSMLWNRSQEFYDKAVLLKD